MFLYVPGIAFLFLFLFNGEVMATEVVSELSLGFSVSDILVGTASVFNASWPVFCISLILPIVFFICKYLIKMSN